MTDLVKKSCVSVCVSVTPHAGRLLNFGSGFAVSFIILKISLLLYVFGWFCVFLPLCFCPCDYLLRLNCFHLHLITPSVSVCVFSLHSSLMEYISVP